VTNHLCVLPFPASRDLYKVEASIVNHVRLTAHYGHVMLTWMRLVFLR
jgi:hypothetical protein